MTDIPSEEQRKWEFLQNAPVSDAQDPELASLATHLWKAASGRLMLYLALCHCMARDGITYTSDVTRTGGEDIAGLTRRPEVGDAMDAFKRGKDDCDAKARFFVALCLAKNVPAKMVPMWRGDVLQHVLAAVRVDGKWIPVETTLARARVGDAPYSVPVERRTGKWLR